MSKLLLLQPEQETKVPEEAEEEEEAEEDDEIDESDPVVIAAREAGKERCRRCKRWLMDLKKNNHIAKCKKCPRCKLFVTNYTRHTSTCKGPKQDKVEKVKCPICPDKVHPQGLLRHIVSFHPDQAEKYRTRPADSKNRSEKRANRKRFYDAHPEKVINYRNFNILLYFICSFLLSRCYLFFKPEEKVPYIN
jgi:hypothetical protein